MPVLFTERARELLTSDEMDTLLHEVLPGRKKFPAEKVTEWLARLGVKTSPTSVRTYRRQNGF